MIAAPIWLDTMCFRFEDILVDEQSRKLIDTYIGKDLCDIVCCYANETVMFLIHEGGLAGVPILPYDRFAPIAIEAADTTPSEPDAAWI